MPKLIEVQAAKEFADTFLPDIFLNMAVHRVLDAVQGVDLVHCKECIHGVWDEVSGRWKCVEDAEYDSNYGEYMGFVYYHNADYYCADGERKENGEIT